jgi:glycine cleavage system transcriptional repressor
MKKWIALSAIGKDQPGIVAALSKILFEKGCNLEDSSMTRLKGDFAILLLVSLPVSLSPLELQAAMEPVARQWSLTFSIRTLEETEKIGHFSSGLPYTLVVYGLDHPGIVYRVTQAAAARGMNITDLRTHVTESNGSPLYSLVVDLDASDEKTAKLFTTDLYSLKNELKVEIAFHPVEADEL